VKETVVFVPLLLARIGSRLTHRRISLLILRSPHHSRTLKATALFAETLCAMRRQSENTEALHMEQGTRIESLGPLDLMGVVMYGNPSKISFHDAWVYPPMFPAPFEFTYMAGIERVSCIDVPIRMLMKTILDARM
jgi:hypothetical protein